MTNHLILSLTSFLDFAFISVFCAAEIQSGHTRVETSSTHNKVGDPHPGVPHLTSKCSALRFEGFLLLGRELSDADAVAAQRRAKKMAIQLEIVQGM